MAKFDDALRGYAHEVLRRDGFVCRYCGLDGKVWPNWLYLSWDHLLPPGNPQRDDPAYIVAACRFCNEMHNRTAWDVDGKSTQEIVAQERPRLLTRRAEYEAFRRVQVAPPPVKPET